MPTRADALRNYERVLAVARRVLAENRLPLQMLEVAKEAGVGVGTVYRHFPTPSDLIEAVVIEHLQATTDAVRAAVDQEDPWRAVVDSLRSGIALHLATAGLAGPYLRPGEARPENLETMAELTRTLEQVVERARTAGVIRPDMSATDLMRLACGIDAAMRGGDHSRVSLYESIVLAGIRASPGAEPSDPPPPLVHDPPVPRSLGSSA